MAIAALVTWVVTALGGFVLLARWISGGGHRPGSGSRLVPGVVFGHFGLAAVGLVVWIIYVAVRTTALAWTGFALLVPVALLGFTMFARWMTSRRTEAAESKFPVPIVLGHGALAATTLVLALLAALGVG